MVNVALERLVARLGDQWRVGDRLPPVRTLAQELGISYSTVHRAVRQMIRGGFLVSRGRRGAYVSGRYSDVRLRTIFADQASRLPSPQRSLAGKRVALIRARDATHMVAAQDAVEAALAPTGCVLFRTSYEEAVQSTAGADNLRVLAQANADALVVFNPDLTYALHGEGQHLVVVTSAAAVPRITTPTYDIVSVEQEHGAALAGRYLREIGSRSACFVCVARPKDRPLVTLEVTSYLRLHGFESGWGQPLSEKQLIPADGYSAVCGARVAALYAGMQPRPEGVFVASDDLAVGFISGLAALGLELDRDYKLVSFDGQLRLEEMRPGGVCGVVVPAAEMGRQAAALLFDRFAHPGQPIRKVLLGCQLNRPASTPIHAPV